LCGIKFRVKLEHYLLGALPPPRLEELEPEFDEPELLEEELLEEEGVEGLVVGVFAG
jgi:hypothetical protein